MVGWVVYEIHVIVGWDGVRWVIKSISWWVEWGGVGHKIHVMVGWVIKSMSWWGGEVHEITIMAG